MNNNNEMRRFFEGVHRDLTERFESMEKKVDERMTRSEDASDKRVTRIESKLDDVQEKCVGCAREFGEVSVRTQNTEREVREHKASHRWHTGLAATIAGLLVAAVAFVKDLIWRG